MKRLTVFCISGTILFTLGFLTSCNSISSNMNASIIADAESKYINKELFAIGDGKCLKPIYGTNNTFFPKEYRIIDCKQTLGDRYIIEKVDAISCKVTCGNSGDRLGLIDAEEEQMCNELVQQCNNRKGSIYYLQTQSGLKIAISETQLKRGQFPIGFADKQGLLKHKQEIALKDKITQEKEAEKRRNMQKNIIVWNKIDNNPEKIIENSCLKMSQNSNEERKCKDKLSYQIKREQSGQLKSCRTPNSDECYMVIHTMLQSFMHAMQEEQTEDALILLKGSFLMVGNECNCSIRKLF